jgi:hypothetical protein
MASETQPLLGSVKRIRAILDLNYKGKEIRGSRRVKVDGKLGTYEIHSTAGQTAEVDQAFAKEVVMSGKAVIVSGGQVEVVPQEDGFHIYKSWLKNLSDPAPVYECCELLKPLFLGDGCHLPAGSKIRIDVRSWDRRKYFYSDETQQADHTFRVMAPSPKRVKLNAVEQAGKVNAIFDKLFPVTA